MHITVPEGAPPWGVNKPDTVALQVCPSTGRPCDCGAGSEGANKDPQASDFWVESTAVDKLGTGGSATWQKPSAEPIFPNELRKASPASLHIPGPKAAWYR